MGPARAKGMTKRMINEGDSIFDESGKLLLLIYMALRFNLEMCDVKFDQYMVRTFNAKTVAVR